MPSVATPFAGVVALAAVVGAAVPSTASAALSLKRAEREAVHAVAPARAESAFCLRPTAIARAIRDDRAFCVVRLASPPGTTCTALVVVQRRATLQGTRVSAREVSEASCVPTPVPLSQSDL